MTNKRNPVRPARLTRHAWPLGLTLCVPRFLHAEDQVDYRYEYYKEDNNRMTIFTHSVYFEQKLVDAITAKGELVYDGISGATPTGGYNGKNVLYTHLEDTRRSLSLQLDSRLGHNTITPGFAYSKESDYQSYGVSLNDAIDFNDKNTTLQFGVSQNFDNVRHADRVNWSNKYSTEGMVGITQLLSPKTTANATFTFGNDSGYLKDPYRVIDFSLSGFAYPEVRPSHRNKEVVYLDVNHFFDSVNAAGDLSYRFYNDSYGVMAHTVEATWTQHLGKYVILEPLARYYEQSAADFYRTSVNNLYPGAPFGEKPTFYSADYRLSNLETFTYGTQLTFIIKERIFLDLGYHRYEMFGLDGSTPSGAYPKANIYTAGVRFTW